MSRACVAGALAVALLAGLPGTPGFAATDVVPGAGMLAAPSGLTPDDSTAPYPHAVLKNVKLDWAPVAGATGYRVQVGRDSTWSGAPILSKDVAFSEWTLPIALPNASYVWRVAALHGTTLGHWSSETGQPDSEASFTKGWRAAPVLNAVTVPFVGVPSFSWSPVADASGYELQASTDPFFNAATSTGPTPDTSPSPTTQTQAPDAIAECFTGRTRYTPASDVTGHADTVGACLFAPPTAGATVYWRVRALDAYATGPVTSPTTPQQDSLSSTSPSLSVAPIRASVAGNWSTVASFTYTPSATASNPLAVVPTTSLASDPDHLCTVVNAGSTQAEHALCRDVPTIQWADAGVDHYRVTLSLDDEFTNIQYQVDTPATQWTAPGAWADSSAVTSFYYAVQACDTNSCGPVTSTPRSFSKVTPRLTLGATPPVKGEFSLSWQPYAAALRAATGQAETQDAYAYHVQVAQASDPGYSSPIEDAVVDETYFTPLKDDGDGSFIWRVQPGDNAGDPLPWSVSQAFTRDSTPPNAVSVTPSSKVGVLQPLKVVFSEVVTGVSASTLRLSPAATTSVTSAGDGLTYTLTPTKALRPGMTYSVVVGSGVKDLAGNTALSGGPSLSVNPVVDDGSKALAYGGTWKALSASNALGGGFRASSPTPTAHTTDTLGFGGTGVALYSCLGPGNGYLDVYVDGVKKSRVSLYRSYSGCGVKVLALSGLARAGHTLKLVGIGAHPAASKGNAVTVDALKVTP